MAKQKEQQGAAELNETLNKSEAFFLKYKKAIIIAVAAIVLIVLGCILVKNYVLEPKEQEASTALAKGQEYFNAEQFDKALKGDGATFKGFLNIAADYSGTDAGNLANLYAGLCYAHQQKPDWKKALEYVDKFDTADDMEISPASQMALGDIYANNDQLDKAVDCFKNAAKMADKQAEDNTNLSIAPLALKKAGIILESQNKKAEALEIYQDIKKKYVNSPAFQDIDKYIERASN
jgi:tetratricopeptide (TPR) repeat protein